MKPRLLIVGSGDIARRALPVLRHRYQVYACCRQPAQAQAWREAGARVLMLELDQPASLMRLAGLADAVLYTAPPPAFGQHDPRVRRVIAALQNTLMVPQQIVYISTTGVYGDCAGAWVSETRPLAAQSERALRRVDAEQAWRDYARRHGVTLSILRAPGIYAAERLPLAIARPAPGAVARGLRRDPQTEDVGSPVALAGASVDWPRRR